MLIICPIIVTMLQFPPIDGNIYKHCFIIKYYVLLLCSLRNNIPVTAAASLSSYINILSKVMEDLQPNYALACSDAPRGSTFRSLLYPPYKAHRDPTRPQMKEQLSLTRDITKALGISYLDSQYYEADDIIASYGLEYYNRGYKVVIVSGDKDLMQLVRLSTNGSIRVYNPRKRSILDEKDCLGTFGVFPHQVPHVQALSGDSSDNIPGVPGIGIRTAGRLIAKFGSIHSLLKNVDLVKNDVKRRQIKSHFSEIELYLKLTTLKSDIPLSLNQLDYTGAENGQDILKKIF